MLILANLIKSLKRVVRIVAKHFKIELVVDFSLSVDLFLEHWVKRVFVVRVDPKDRLPAVDP